MSKSNKVSQLFTVKRIAIPVIVGLIVTAYMLYSNTDWAEFGKVKWRWKSFLWILGGLLMMVLRDIAYMYRIKVLTDNKINWRNSFDVIMLWEFSSAVTPGIVGGTGVALYILKKEGLSLGKSTSTVMLTALFDQLFYIVTVPIVILMVGTQNLFPVELQKEIFGVIFSVKGIFVIGFLVTLMFGLLFVFGIFIHPKGLKNVLSFLFKFGFLKKWHHKMEQVGDEFVQTAADFKNKPFLFWLKASLATLFSWTARFCLINFLILAFTPAGNHLLIYARQLIMWIVMIISPTPGGTGVAEFVFEGFLSEFTPIGLAGLLAVLWRLGSYYPYLIIGLLILPKWLKKVYS
ncbi:MAG: lysylphosphatidylglycerol synthase transmembrane domain-containing protein [Vicingaceae bacterium]|nr:lysylphosphatidylglycerol synthase transmembrane domain-containing protein [Vicingaceae bacterium]